MQAEPPRPPPVPRTAAQLLLGWVAVCAVVLGIGWLLTGPLADSVGGWDEDASRWIADRRTSGLDGAAEVGTLVADTIIGLPLGLAAAAALSWWRRSWLPGACWVLITAGIQGVYLVAVALISRDRPPVKILDPGLVPDHSFPSGHVATSVSAYAGIAVLLIWLAPRAARWAWLLFLVPLVVVASRLYEGAHHPTDALTSLVYATAWLTLVTVLVLRRTDPPQRA